MSIFQFNSMDFLNGGILGLLCVLGIALGVTLLFRAMAEKKNKVVSRRYGLMGALALVGQFFLAGFYVYKIAPGILDPLSFGLGLMGVILLSAGVVKYFQKTP